MTKPILDNRFLDHRTLKRNLAQGLVKEEDYQKFLKSLPDESENCETVPFEDETSQKEP